MFTKVFVRGFFWQPYLEKQKVCPSNATNFYHKMNSQANCAAFTQRNTTWQDKGKNHDTQHGWFLKPWQNANTEIHKPYDSTDLKGNPCTERNYLQWEKLESSCWGWREREIGKKNERMFWSTGNVLHLFVPGSYTVCKTVRTLPSEQLRLMLLSNVRYTSV